MANVKSDAVRRALKALERAGKLTAEDVVSAARDPESPLHAFFEWDDARAADAWRLEQARTLIRSVQIRVSVEEGRAISVPVYVRDPDAEHEVQGYRTLENVRGNPAAAKAALLIEVIRVEGLLARAERIAEACGLAGDVKALSARVKRLRGKIA